VSVDPPEASKRLRERLESRFTFLSDPDGVLLDALGIRHRDARGEGRDIAFPTAVLVDGRGTVRWVFQSDTYRERARPEDVFAALGSLRGTED
jgi:peroxiredoxin